MCNKQLSTGEELYVLDELKFICKEDYQNSQGRDTVLLSGETRTPTRTRNPNPEPLCSLREDNAIVGSIVSDMNI
jgi:hypothetical protein